MSILEKNPIHVSKPACGLKNKIRVTKIYVTLKLVPTKVGGIVLNK